MNISMKRFEKFLHYPYERRTSRFNAMSHVSRTRLGKRPVGFS
jgi:hypothetical protein